MTNEEAIETLKTMYPKKCKMIDGRFIGGYDDYESEKGQAVTLAIKVIEKQIPKKPKYVEVEQDTLDMKTGETYKYKLYEAHCSCCGFIIGVEGDIFEECYCGKCSQAIDWSEEGEGRE